MSRTIAIRHISAEPGTKAFGMIKIAERPGSSVKMPVGIVNGSKPGPVLCLTAGKHAVEYPGIDAAIRLFKQTDPIKLRGAILIVPVVNVPAFDTQTPFVCPIDNKDIGYLFPGKKEGTISHKIAYTLVEEVITKADVYIDLHGGDLPEWLITYVIFMETEDQDLNQQTELLARLYGTRFIEKTTRPILKIGKKIPAFVGEAGGLGTYEESDISSHVRGVTNVMRYLGMIDGKIILPDIQLLFESKMPDQALDSTESAGFQIVNTNRGGLLYLKVSPGDLVQKGQVLGEIGDLKGDIIEEIVAPCSCAVLMIYPKHAVSSGDPVFFIAPVTEMPSLHLENSVNTKSNCS
jgi:predicted deacylase